MSRNAIHSLALIAIVAALSGCRGNVSDPQFHLFWKSYKNLDQEFTEARRDSSEALRVWHALANDPEAKRDDRAGIIFSIFRVFVRPGMASTDVGSIMKDANWLNSVGIRPYLALGGQVPVEKGPDDVVFAMTVVPRETNHDGWFVWFSLRGLDSEKLTSYEAYSQAALEFWKGTLTDKGVRLAEFALDYPREPASKTEVFSERGVGLNVR
jgi:hypothetical protein